MSKSKYRLSHKHADGQWEKGRDGDSWYHIVGRMHHHRDCSGQTYLTGDGKRRFMCDHKGSPCKPKVDAVHFCCPRCKHEGRMYVADGPTAVEYRRKRKTGTKKGKKLQVFTLIKMNPLSIRQNIFCLGCNSVFSIRDGVAEVQGTHSFGEAEPSTLPQEVQDFLRESDGVMDDFNRG